MTTTRAEQAAAVRYVAANYGDLHAVFVDLPVALSKEALLDAAATLEDARERPTKEDLDVARKLLANVRFVDDDENPDPAIELIAAALQSERSADTDKARRALEESVKLQSHYAALLNDYDGGKRLTFASADEWIARLEKIAALTPQNPGAA